MAAVVSTLTATRGQSHPITTEKLSLQWPSHLSTIAMEIIQSCGDGANGQVVFCD